ncbi:MAG: FHA domain-containing protein [Gaiellaceae bacterium]
MIGDSVAIDELLLVLKIAFIVLLYLFIWQIVRSAGRELRPTQESIVMRPSDAAALGLRRRSGRLVVVESPTLTDGGAYAMDSGPLSIGRGAENDLELRGDEFASASHARFEPRQDGVWVVDRGSTNGTYVNGIRLDGPRLLEAGDVIRIGETQLRFDA